MVAPWIHPVTDVSKCNRRAIGAGFGFKDLPKVARSSLPVPYTAAPSQGSRHIASGGGALTLAMWGPSQTRVAPTHRCQRKPVRQVRRTCAGPAHARKQEESGPVAPIRRRDDDGSAGDSHRHNKTKPGKSNACLRPSGLRGGMPCRLAQHGRLASAACPFPKDTRAPACATWPAPPARRRGACWQRRAARRRGAGIAGGMQESAPGLITRMDGRDGGAGLTAARRF
ncbi:hypothetical protein L602_004500000030 [Cupriavidus gilardii J11]|uniref:Uncharacterized protein n=1 Tax=Cupriavidus gilardii J11 TaxID=936133 RepID=A0A562B886_9BURK|nr:hypothetical protein L602_004500000030 [Cupriavidus gilardii J11]